MATYAIGDLQGCYDELRRLLDHIHYDPVRDTLWFVGDLVNRGPQSLECLRFVAGLQNAITVLGNHDLSLLATAEGFRKPSRHDTLDAVLAAPDLDRFMTWLRQQPLLHEDPALGYTMLHAGLPPQWSIAQAKSLAQEVSDILRGNQYRQLLGAMFGNEPKQWSDQLSGADRWRFIINALTRMRYCTADGQLDLSEKGAPGTQRADLLPWYQVPDRQSRHEKIICGHWSTLGFVQRENIFAIDTGCIWGGRLSALRIDASEPEYASITCEMKQTPGNE